MGTPDPTTGIMLKNSTDKPSPLWAYVNESVQSIVDFLKARLQKSYEWPTLAAMNAQTGMSIGSTGYRTDENATYRYFGLGTGGWKLWQKARTKVNLTMTNFSSSTVAVTTTAYVTVQSGWCTVEIQSKLGTGTITVGDVSVNLPYAMNVTDMSVGTAIEGNVMFRDITPAAIYQGVPGFVDANTVKMYAYSTANPAGGRLATLAASPPFTFATTDEISAVFKYPLA